MLSINLSIVSAGRSFSLFWDRSFKSFDLTLSKRLSLLLLLDILACLPPYRRRAWLLLNPWPSLLYITVFEFKFITQWYYVNNRYHPNKYLIMCLHIFSLTCWVSNWRFYLNAESNRLLFKHFKGWVSQRYSDWTSGSFSPLIYSYRY